MQTEIPDQCRVIPTNRLQFFPIMMFAIVMGLSGLAIVFQKAHHIFGFPSIFGDILVVLDTLVFLVVISFYLAKIFKHFDEVKKEFAHPVRINFFAASSISFLLLSIVYQQISTDITQYLFYIGTFMQTFFTFYTISYWINKNLEIKHSNPAWFIPIVGNILVPVAGVGIVDTHILMYYFSVGLFFWVIFTSIIINRIIFHHQLAVKFIPTLFIFIAPPAIALIAYVKMYGEYDITASIFYNLALFFGFLILFMYKNFLHLKFFISWWAFTFPLAAISLASMLAYEKTAVVLYSYFAYLFITITTVVVLLVTYKTFTSIMKKEICVEE